MGLGEPLFLGVKLSTFQMFGILGFVRFGVSIWVKYLAVLHHLVLHRSSKRMDDLRPVVIEPAPVVLCTLEAFVGHVGPREGRAHACEPRVGSGPHREEGFGQWRIGGGGTPETETRYCPGGLYSGKQGEALVPPYAVGPADVGLSGEPAMPAALGVPDGHSRAIECLIGRSLTLQHLPQFHSDLLDVLSIESHEPVELGTVWKGRECCSQMCLGVAVEVPFAGEPRPPSEDREGDDLTTTEGGIRTGSASYGSMRLAKIVDHDVKCGEEGVHVNHEESVPFPSGLVSKPTLVRGHLPLKSSRDNSHQAFKNLARLARLDPKLLYPLSHRGEDAQAHMALMRSPRALIGCGTQLVNHVPKGRSSPSGQGCPSALPEASTTRRPSTYPRPCGRPSNPSSNRSLRSPSVSANTRGCLWRSPRSTTRRPSCCARWRVSGRSRRLPSCLPWRTPTASKGAARWGLTWGWCRPQSGRERGILRDASPRRATRC